MRHAPHGSPGAQGGLFLEGQRDLNRTFQAMPPRTESRVHLIRNSFSRGVARHGWCRMRACGVKAARFWRGAASQKSRYSAGRTHRHGRNAFGSRVDDILELFRSVPKMRVVWRFFTRASRPPTKRRPLSRRAVALSHSDLRWSLLLKLLQSHYVQCLNCNDNNFAPKRNRTGRQLSCSQKNHCSIGLRSVCFNHPSDGTQTIYLHEHHTVIEVNSLRPRNSMSSCRLLIVLKRCLQEWLGESRLSVSTRCRTTARSPSCHCLLSSRIYPAARPGISGRMSNWIRTVKTRLR